LAEELIRQFGYVGIGLILILGGLGLPIPEEVPIILAAILTRNGQMSVLPAVASCLLGVLLGDFVVYLLGYFYGEKVLRFPLTRRFLTRQREAQIKGYFHRHGYKILVSGRLVPGFRSAAYLTAGILKLPTLRLLVTDLVAVTLSTSLMFGLGFFFADQIQNGIREVQQWLTVLVAVGVGSWLLHRYYRARQRAGQLVGPPVLDVDEIPLPPLEFAESGPPVVHAAADGRSAVGGGLRPASIEPDPPTDPAAAAPAGHSESPVGIDVAPSPASTTVQSPSR
jgi:membrane protein DedA with SNARE-associated domain